LEKERRDPEKKESCKQGGHGALEGGGEKKENRPVAPGLGNIKCTTAVREKKKMEAGWPKNEGR